MRRSLVACTALFGSSLVIWACATSALPIDNIDVPETGAPDTSQASNDAGCPQYDINNDPKHCGSCTKACTDLQVCAAGACKAACDLPTVKCIGDGGAAGCVDLTKDPAHCGGCNTVCSVMDASALPTDNGNPDAGIPFDGGWDGGIAPQPGTPTCAASKCGVNCPGPTTLCSDNVCYDTNNNHDHCGNCTTACATDTEWCNSGHCCATGTEYCSTACVNVLTDPNNCGSCGNICPKNAPNCSQGGCFSGFTHNDGFNDTWVDQTPLNTYNITEATAACNAYVAAHPADSCNTQGCGCGGNDVCVYNTASNNGQTRRTWFYGGGAHNGQVTDNSCSQLNAPIWH
jgi:hypothetical protein